MLFRAKTGLLQWHGYVIKYTSFETAEADIPRATFPVIESIIY